MKEKEMIYCICCGKPFTPTHTTFTPTRAAREFSRIQLIMREMCCSDTCYAKILEEFRNFENL